MTRGTGITTRQMEQLPKHSLFIWCNGNLYYPTTLARKLGRQDLRIVGPDFVFGEGWRGICYPGMALDHAFCGQGMSSQRLADFLRLVDQMSTLVRTK